MKPIFKQFVLVLASACLGLTSCITSQIKPLTQAGNRLLSDSSSVTIFLLERDIPKDIEQVGVISLSVNIRPGLTIDQQVKKQLQKDCQRLGATGAYRISDGTYYPTIVSYLVFRYKK